MNVPVTFDDPTVNYGLVGFGGAEDATVVTDPTLATNKVGRVVKSNTAELWAGASITALAGTVQTSFANAIPFTATERRMNVRVWSPHTGISIKLKVEDKTDPTKSCETDAMFTGAANTWQTLEFNFNNQSAGTAAFNPAFTFNKASIFFNFGVTGATAGARTYFFDDVKFGPAPIPPPPPAPAVTSPVIYCQNSTAVPLSAVALAGNTLQWYTLPVAGTASTTAPTPSTATPGTTNFYVSQKNSAGVEGARAVIIVTVNSTPIAPIVSTPLLICLNAQSVSLTATAATGNTLKWYTTATGGVGLTNAPTTVTSAVGSTNYYVSQTNSIGCEGPRALLITTIVAPPTAPNITATPGTQLIPGQTITITTENGPGTGNTFSWLKNGVVLSSQTGNSIPVNIDGVGNYTLKIANSIGCERSSNTIVINGASSNKLFLYPSPSTGKFQVRYFTDANNLKPLQMTIYNSAGALIYSARYTIFSNYNPMAVDLTRHGNGFYYVHLLSADGKVLVTETVIIQN